MQKPFVIYILTHLELGGAQKVCLTLLDHFAKKTGSMLITGTKGQLLDQAKSVGQVIQVNELVNQISLLQIVQDLKAFVKIYRAIKEKQKRHKNLAVHTHNSKAGIIGRWAAWAAGCKKIVHTVHGFSFNPYQNRLKFIFFWIAEFLTNLITTHLIFVSKKDQAYATSKMLLSNKKSSLIRACAAHEPKVTVTPAKRADSLITIGTISCLKPQKNIFDLLKAFKSASDRLDCAKTLKLEIVGDGPLRKSVESWILANNLSGKVVLHGWMKNPAGFFKKIDIFAMSSLWEGLPCAVVEAKLFNLPVVAYDVGGISEVISDNQNGFIVSPGDVNMLSSRLESLANNQSLRKKMSQSKTFFFEFKKTRMIYRHEKLYKKI